MRDAAAAQFVRQVATGRHVLAWVCLTRETHAKGLGVACTMIAAVLQTPMQTHAGGRRVLASTMLAVQCTMLVVVQTSIYYARRVVDLRATPALWLEAGSAVAVCGWVTMGVRASCPLPLPAPLVAREQPRLRRAPGPVHGSASLYTM